LKKSPCTQTEKNLRKRTPLKQRDASQAVQKASRKITRTTKAQQNARLVSQNQPASPPIFATNLQVDKTIKEKLHLIGSKRRPTDRYDEDYAELWKLIEASPSFSKAQVAWDRDKLESLNSVDPKKSPSLYTPFEASVLSSFFSPSPEKQLKMIVCPKELKEDSSCNSPTHRNPHFAVFHVADAPKNGYQTQTIHFGTHRSSEDLQMASSLTLVDSGKHWPQDSVRVKVPQLVLVQSEELTRWQTNLFFRRQRLHEPKFRALNKSQALDRLSDYTISEEIQMLKKSLEDILKIENQLIKSLE